MREGSPEHKEPFVPIPRDLERERRRQSRERRHQRPEAQPAKGKVVQFRQSKQWTPERTLEDDRHELGILEQRLAAGDLKPGTDDYKRWVDLKAGVNLAEGHRLSKSTDPDWRDTPYVRQRETVSEYLKGLSDEDLRVELERTRMHAKDHPDARQALRSFHAELDRRRQAQPSQERAPAPQPGPEIPQNRDLSDEEMERHLGEAVGPTSLLQEEEEQPKAPDAVSQEEVPVPRGEEPLVEDTSRVPLEEPSPTEPAEPSKPLRTQREIVEEKLREEELERARQEESKPLRTQYEIVKERLDADEALARAREEEERARKEQEAARQPAETPVQPEPTRQPPEAVPPPERPKRQWKAGVVGIEQKVEEIARHRAEERLQAELRGERPEGGKRPGWFRRLILKTSRHWGEYGYRQKYIAEERKRILSQIEGLEANIFAPDEKTAAAHREETNAIVQRFLADFDGAVREREGERRESLAEGQTKTAIRELMTRYVNGDVDEKTFVEQKAQLLQGLRAENQALFEREGPAVDNLLDVAREIRATTQHGERIAAQDLNVDVNLGRYRSAIKEEVNQRAFDKLVKNIQKNPVLSKVVNPAVLGFTVSLATKPLISGIRGLAKYSGLGALGAGTVVGAGFAAVRRSTELKGDAAHGRRGQAMGYEIPKGAKRLEKMKEFAYDTVRATNLTDNVRSSVELLESLDLSDPRSMQRVQETLQAIAAIEARLDLGTATKHDFMTFDDPTTIERQRLEMLKTIAEAKVKVQAIYPQVARVAGNPSTMEQSLGLHKETREGELRTRVEDVDRRFKNFKRMEVAKAAAYGAVTGFVAGSLAQWGANLFREHVLGERNVPQTWTEKLWSKITGTTEYEDPGTWHSNRVGDHGRLVLPEGLKAIDTPGKPGFISILDTRDGQPMHEPLRLTPDGHLPNDVKHDLLRDGIKIGERDVVEGSRTVVSASEYAKINETEMAHVARGPVMHLDQDTPDDPDFNERRMFWGGENGTGLDRDGNIVLDVGKMLKDWSYKGQLHVDPNEVLESGDTRMYVTLTHETQKLAFEVVPDEHGQAVIEKGSEAFKAFSIEDGRPKFHGWTIEAAQRIRNPDDTLMIDPDDGDQHIRMFASLRGDESAELVTDTRNPRHIIDVLRPKEMEWPPTIPLSKRKPLEAMARDKRETVPPYYSYSSEALRKEFHERLSDTLKKNPDAQLDERAEVSKYLEHLDPAYRAELEAFDDSINDPMAKETRLVVMIPAFQEAKNIQKSLEQYASQTTVDGKPLEPKTFEIIVFVNRPEHVPDDGTMAQIAEFKAKHPEMRVQAISKVFPSDEVSIGRYRKYIGDLALVRSQRRKQRDGSLTLVSNDADMDHVAPTYVDRMVRDFDEHPKVDAYAGKIDFAEGEVYEKYPLFLGVQRAMQYLDRGLRGKDYRARPRTLGNNTAVRADMYAAVGGYITGATLAEDLQIGEMIEQARQGTTREPIKYENRAEIVVNPRRHVAKLKEGIPLVAMYDDWARNETIRNKNWQKLVEGDTETISTPRLENELSLLYEWMQREVGGRRVKDLNALFDRAMRFLGMRYELHETMEPNREGKMERKTKVRILDTSRFDKSLAEYPERYKKVRTAKEQREQRRTGRPKTVSEELRDEVPAARVATAEQEPEETPVAGTVEAPGSDDDVIEHAAATPAVEAASGTAATGSATVKPGAKTGEERAGETAARADASDAESPEAEAEEVDPKILRSALINQGVPEATLRVVNDETLVRGFQGLIRNNGYQNADVIRQVLARDFNTPRLATAFVKNEDLLRRMAEVRRLVLAGKKVEAKPRKKSIEDEDSGQGRLAVEEADGEDR